MNLRLTGLENPTLAATVGLLASYSSRFAASKNAVSSNISAVEKRWHPSKKAISFKVSRCVTPTQLSEDSHFKT